MGKGAMGLFGTNMGDFQLGLAMDDKAGGYLETDEEIAQVRTRRPAVLRRLHAIDARRLRESRWWVVAFSILMLRDAAPPRRRPYDHTRVRGGVVTPSSRAGRRPPGRHQGGLAHGRRGHRGLHGHEVQ